MTHLLPISHWFSSAKLPISRFALTLALLGGAQAGQAQNTPFSCTAGKSYIFQGDITAAVEIDLSTGRTTATSGTIIPSGNQKLNAFGYNAKDSFIWGLRLGSNQVVRVGSDYQATIYNVDNLSADGAAAVVGDVSPRGIMYITRGGSTGGNSSNAQTAFTIYSIDLTKQLTTASPNYTATALAVTTPSYINDWAVSPVDGHLYAIYATIASAGNPAALTLYRFLTSPVTTAGGTVLPVGTRQALGTVVPENTAGATNPIAASNFASCFMDASGNFYVASSDNGYIYRINQPHTTPLNLTAYYIGTGPSGTLNNDGARCLQSAIAPLPVELTAFSATAAPNQTVRLAWTTASELKNSYFDVQRSLDGRIFESVGRVAGRGSSQQATEYTFADATPGAEATHYYRLRQVDVDGSSAFSPVRVVSLAASSSAVQLSVAPNPTTADNLRVQVQFNGTAPAAAVLTMHSTLGQALLTQAVTLQPGANLLTPSINLTPGAYWVAVRGATTLGQQGVRVLVGN